MLKKVFIRQAIAFLIISLASIVLYPAAQARLTLTTWLLLGMVILAAILILMTK
jgi:hypothetical protein